ncbi:MAG: YciI family protein [Aliidongia sp.]
MAGGKLVVFGPVGDPKGVWGLGVVRSADEGEARALADADPVIQADRGFSYEILPMLSAMVAPGV